MLLNCAIREDSWESLGLQGDPTSPFWRRSVLGVHWKDWCWSWNSNTLATSCEELTHWKRPWCWEGLQAGGEGDDRGWDGWMASLTWWAWVWINSRSLWWTGRPGMLQFRGSQRVGHDWATELNWTSPGIPTHFCLWVGRSSRGHQTTHLNSPPSGFKNSPSSGKPWLLTWTRSSQRGLGAGCYNIWMTCSWLLRTKKTAGKGPRLC